MSSKEWKQQHLIEQQAYKRKHYHSHKGKILLEVRLRKKELSQKLQVYKGNLQCTYCPETFAACLDFHHIDGTTKEIDIAQAANSGWSWERTLLEIKKCIIVCANCHRKIHAGVLLINETIRKS